MSSQIERRGSYNFVWSTVHDPVSPPPRIQVPVRILPVRVSEEQVIVPATELGFMTAPAIMENGEDVPLKVIPPPNTVLFCGLFRSSGPNESIELPDIPSILMAKRQVPVAFRL